MANEWSSSDWSLLEDVMRRIAFAAIFILGSAIGAAAQRSSPGTVNNNYWTGQGAGFSQLQWFMMTNAVPNSSAGNAAPTGTGRVSVDALQVPEAAMREMAEFQKKFDAGKLEDAEKHIEKAIKIYPKWASAHHNLGQVLARLREYEKAIPEFEAAGELDPKMVQPWVSLAG